MKLMLGARLSIGVRIERFDASKKERLRLAFSLLFVD